MNLGPYDIIWFPFPTNTMETLWACHSDPSTSWTRWVVLIISFRRVSIWQCPILFLCMMCVLSFDPNISLSVTILVTQTKVSCWNWFWTMFILCPNSIRDCTNVYINFNMKLTRGLNGTPVSSQVLLANLCETYFTSIWIIFHVGRQNTICQEMFLNLFMLIWLLKLKIIDVNIVYLLPIRVVIPGVNEFPIHQFKRETHLA